MIARSRDPAARLTAAARWSFPASGTSPCGDTVSRGLGFPLPEDDVISSRVEGGAAGDSGPQGPSIRRALEGGPPPQDAARIVGTFALPPGAQHPSGGTPPGPEFPGGGRSLRVRDLPAPEVAGRGVHGRRAIEDAPPPWGSDQERSSGRGHPGSTSSGRRTDRGVGAGYGERGHAGFDAIPGGRQVRRDPRAATTRCVASSPRLAVELGLDRTHLHKRIKAMGLGGE